MLKKSLLALSVLVMATLLVSCTCKSPTVTAPFSPVKLTKGDHLNKVDNFIVILDASQSMGDKFSGEKKSVLAMETVRRFNQTIPTDMHLNGSLRTFGHGACLSTKKTTLQLYELQPYAQAGFGEALENVTCDGGNSPLADALNAVGEDLQQMQGKSALIIVSDGKDMRTAPLTAARNLAAAYADICIYTVQVGDDQAGAALLGDVAKVSSCGYMTNYEGIYDAGNMAKFVKSAFFGEMFVPTPVPAAPTAMDSDGDGVLDEDDRCPNTPQGARIDQYGCWTISNVLFDFDKSTLKSEFHAGLDEIIAVFGQNPGLQVEIQGHTCNIGPAAYNQKLSERRAKAVFDYLVEKGVDASQLSAVGFGLARPLVSNATREGRIKNRRVEFRPVQ